MHWDFAFFLNSILFGAGLAMDAFSVSLANGLRQPDMPRRAMVRIAAVFGAFQTAMPLLGWVCVHTVAQTFTAAQRYIPWVALALLVFLGGRMIAEGLQGKSEADEVSALGLRALLLQGVATSIDALSVGFTIAGYTWPFALAEAAVIGAVTFALCLLALRLGRRFGMVLAGRATVLGGVILVVIGLEIFIKSLL